MCENSEPRRWSQGIQAQQLYYVLPNLEITQLSHGEAERLLGAELDSQQSRLTPCRDHPLLSQRRGEHSMGQGREQRLWYKAPPSFFQSHPSDVQALGLSTDVALHKQVGRKKRRHG